MNYNLLNRLSRVFHNNSLAGTGKKSDPLEVVAPGGDFLLADNNLSDVASAATSRTNLGLPSGTYTPTFTAQNDVLNTLVASAPFMYSYIGAIGKIAGWALLTLQGGAVTDDFHFDTPVLRTTNFSSSTQAGGIIQTITFSDLLFGKLNSESGTKVLTMNISTAAADANLLLYIEVTFQTD